MKKKKKISGAIVGMKLPKQVQRQMQAKYETVEEMREKSQKRDEALQKRGFLKSHASISSSYGILNGMKSTYGGAKKKISKFLNVISIPMK